MIRKGKKPQTKTKLLLKSSSSGDGVKKKVCKTNRRVCFYPKLVREKSKEKAKILTFKLELKITRTVDAFLSFTTFLDNFIKIGSGGLA